MSSIDKIQKIDDWNQVRWRDQHIMAAAKLLGKRTHQMPGMKCRHRDSMICLEAVQVDSMCLSFSLKFLKIIPIPRKEISASSLEAWNALKSL